VAKIKGFGTFENFENFEKIENFRNFFVGKIMFDDDCIDVFG